MRLSAILEGVWLRSLDLHFHADSQFDLAGRNFSPRARRILFLYGTLSENYGTAARIVVGRIDSALAALLAKSRYIVNGDKMFFFIEISSGAYQEFDRTISRHSRESGNPDVKYEHQPSSPPPSRG